MAIQQVRATLRAQDGSLAYRVNPGGLVSAASAQVALDAPAVVTDTDIIVPMPEPQYADPDGSVFFEVYANEDLTPQNTVWIMHIWFEGQRSTLSFVVPNGTPTHTDPIKGLYWDIVLDGLYTAIPSVPGSFVQGPKGDTGPEGPEGPPGPASGGNPFVYNQVSPQATWVIPHMLGYNPPAIMVLDSSGEECEGAPTYVDPNHLQLDFSAAFAGVATLK